MFNEHPLQFRIPGVEKIRFSPNTLGGDPKVNVSLGTVDDWQAGFGLPRPDSTDQDVVEAWLTEVGLTMYTLHVTEHHVEVTLNLPSGEHDKEPSPDGRWKNQELLFWVALHDGQGRMKLVSHQAIVPSLRLDESFRSTPGPYASLRFYQHYEASLRQWLIMEGFGVVDFAPSMINGQHAIYLILRPPK